MKRTYTKYDFENLDYEDRQFIIEDLLPFDYYHGQEKFVIQFPDHDPNRSTELPELTAEAQQREDEGFEILVDELTTKLFLQFPTIEFDIESRRNEIEISDKEFLEKNAIGNRIYNPKKFFQ